MTERTNEAAVVAWLCKYDGSVHRRGVHHDGDTPLVIAHPNPEPPTGDGEREGVGA